MPMRIAITGIKGQVVECLKERASGDDAVEMITLGRPTLDLAIPDTVLAALTAVKPDVIVNAAAYTAVDKAETDQAQAFAINRDGAGAAAAAAAKLGIPFIQISTDYVFSGDKPAPYVETDPTGPLGVYGHSKLAGENAVRASHGSPIILRTAWVYSPYGANFVKTMLRLARDRDRLRVVDDQIGNPTSALDIADGILRITRHLREGVKCAGTYHMSGAGEVNWYGLARHIFSVSKSLGGPSAEIEAIPTSEFPTPARRPKNSRLDNSLFAQTFGESLPQWPKSVEACVTRLVT
jgi:dTDP-4-dehydrorhamnose reductase